MYPELADKTMLGRKRQKNKQTNKQKKNKVGWEEKRTKKEREEGAKEGKKWKVNVILVGHSEGWYSFLLKVWSWQVILEKEGGVPSDFSSKKEWGWNFSQSLSTSNLGRTIKPKRGQAHVCHHLQHPHHQAWLMPLIIQGVHLCACHLSCSLWSEKQMTGKCQTLACVGVQW